MPGKVTSHQSESDHGVLPVFATTRDQRGGSWDFELTFPPWRPHFLHRASLTHASELHRFSRSARAERERIGHLLRDSLSGTALTRTSFKKAWRRSRRTRT